MLSRWIYKPRRKATPKIVRPTNRANSSASVSTELPERAAPTAPREGADPTWVPAARTERAWRFIVLEAGHVWRPPGALRRPHNTGRMRNPERTLWHRWLRRKYPRAWWCGALRVEVRPWWVRDHPPEGTAAKAQPTPAKSAAISETAASWRATRASACSGVPEDWVDGSWTAHAFRACIRNVYPRRVFKPPFPRRGRRIRRCAWRCGRVRAEAICRRSGRAWRWDVPDSSRKGASTGAEALVALRCGTSGVNL